MTPAEAYAVLVAMHEADIDNCQNGRAIVRFIIDTLDGAMALNDTWYLQGFLVVAKSEDIGPRFAIAVLRTTFEKRAVIGDSWYDLRDNTHQYLIKLDKPGRERMMRGLMEERNG